MFSKFKYKRLDLKSIRLDDRNPRIVTQSKLSSQQEIVRYFFEHEGLGKFLAKIASEGKNPGAERPYVVSEGDGFVVVEGNTRIAAYKLLSGEIAAPPEFSSQVPQVSDALKKSLEEVHCAIAPSRDDLLGDYNLDKA